MRAVRGFTIIELLVIIAIIAILATIIIPSVMLGKKMGNRAKCAAHLHDIGVALQLYLDDSSRVMPYAAAMPSLHLNEYPRIVDVLAKQSSGAEMWRCPSDNSSCYYKSEGSSYQYNTMFCGVEIDKAFKSGGMMKASTVAVFFDYEPYHGPAGTKGSANYLFADMHVGDLID